MSTGSMMTITGSTLEIGELPFNLHMMDHMGRLVLFGRKGIIITPEIKDNIEKSGRRFYISHQDLSVYIDYTLKKVKNVVKDPGVNIGIKQTILKDAGNRIIHRIQKEGFDEKTARHSEEFTSSVVNMIVSSPDSYSGLLNVSSINSYLYDHAINTSTFAIMLGTEIYGASEKKLFLLGQGAMLMDIGMTRINSAILDKPGKLTEKEFAVVKQHTRLGHEMLKSHNLHPYIADMALHHHERIDGSGYPDKLKDADIRMYLRICAVADVYDALTSKRSYRREMRHVDAIKVMLSQKNQFSVDVMQALMKIVLKNEQLIQHTLSSVN